MITQAIIAAAGMGTRLKDRTAAMPKGFIEIGGVPIVEQSVKKLIASGIEEIIIGTGHCAEWYEALAKKYPLVTLVHNPDYAETGSMGTLALCAEKAKGGVLVLESDLIYDSAGLFVLHNESRDNVILASGPTKSGDEVYLEAGENQVLLGNSKKKEELHSVYAELVGITRLDKNVLDAMVYYCRAHRTSQPKMEYEAAMSAVSRDALSQAPAIPGSAPVYIRKLEYYQWREIDDEVHLAMAAESVYPRITENESIRQPRREVLLNPGPATTSGGVKSAQICADICPREQEFGAVMRWIVSELSLMAGKKGSVETVLFGGSGTAADEVMISSCVPEGAKLLILDNGAYGERFSKIAASYSIPHDVYKSSGYALPDTDDIKKRLSDGAYSHFALVYHETTTGLLNPAPELCRFCRERGITTIVDAVSAFAAIPIDMDDDGFDFMASTSNKNIQGMAGAAFVFCRKEALEKTREYPMRSYYLNLWDQYSHFAKTGQTRFTPPVQTLYALRQAIIEAKNETIPRRYRRYGECWKILVLAVKELGLSMLVDEQAQSRLITAIVEPEDAAYDFNAFHDLARLKGFTIYPGKLAGANTFRIANIGDIQPEEMAAFTAVMKDYMSRIKLRQFSC
ncbi:MAG: 2-aminoethylphosphonate--pyruvate transaminase [Treponema sp.]|jgi:2-aminoethylphosphonate-pyruvate transaminase|nr:2-aminoethylphosphonate--pyruvate transaminase [Treponema sp.]